MPEIPERRRGVRRVVIVMPSAFTLGNLFFGFWAIVSAANGNFRWAGWFIVFAAILDMLDGRIARLSNTGTKFGAELDSLIDVISFGVAPALVMYFLEFAAAGKFAWVLCFIYVVAAAVRLARYNVLAHDAPYSSWFTGLPSPAAGIVLATWFPFSQTEWYRASMPYLDLQHQGLVVLLLLVALLMVSNVKYPKFPPIGTKSAKRLAGLVFTLALLVGGITYPEYVLFPFALAYIAFGLARSTLLSLMEQRAESAGAYGEPELEDEDDLAAPRRHRIHQERRGRFRRRRQSESNE
ncbi:MAG TPA: CDP-diacylglycerol--serine O-phosphatidyltransferase [Gemmatimonadales bacterium]|nr:CDP-diacylglycerol--serine O-phosphatidyltransferase [Gemmatimonadales bacterium]